MRFLTGEQMRDWDRRAIGERGMAGMALMQRAGAAVARVAARAATQRGARQVTLVAGRGNNGGDAAVAARCLLAGGWRTHLLLTCPPDALRGDARLAFEQARAAGVPWRALAAESDWTAREEIEALSLGVVVDGVVGTGTDGAPRGVAAAAIRWLAAARPRGFVVAIDLPSGLNADTGAEYDPVMTADITVTLAAPKSGFAAPQAWEHLGHVEVVEIGLPPDLEPADDAATPPEVRFSGAPELARVVPHRARAAHKGDFGRLLIVGGSHGMGGAPALAAMGAVRSGTGLVTVAVPEQSLAALAVLAPGAMAHTVAMEQGGMTHRALAANVRAPETFDAVLAGPGMSLRPGTAEIVENLLRGGTARLVLDADALNVLAGQPERLRRTGEGGCSVTITPHPGEAARLLGVSVREVQADRVAAARRLAARSGAVVVLKGAGTLVCTPDGRVWMNLTGNPGMARGGSGDVLAGMIAGFEAQGVEEVAAARLAVYLHGTAGDLAAWQAGEPALAPEDLGRHLGGAFRWLTEVASDR